MTDLEPVAPHPEQTAPDRTKGIWSGERYLPEPEYEPYVEEPYPYPVEQPMPRPEPSIEPAAAERKLNPWQKQKMIARVMVRARKDGWLWKRKRKLFVNERTQQAERLETIFSWYYKEGDEN